MNWQDSQAYAYTAQLDGSGWAWEFLRRNPDYQTQWRTFMAIWKDLEADYGAAPARDFPRWKRDLRANVFEPPLAEGETIDQWVARTGNDCIAIECAFGARWGVFKFPPDPSKTALELGDGLGWREVPQLAKVMTAKDTAYLGNERQRVALGFDLDMPLKLQLEQARVFLIARQHRLKRDDAMSMRRVNVWADQWRLMLRCWDARQQSASAAGVLLSQDEEQRLYAQANELVYRDYRQLSLVPR